MGRLPYRAIVLAALSFAFVNQLWLIGGNAAFVADSQRGLWKGCSLAAAVIIYVAFVITVARRAGAGWWKLVAASAGLAVGFAAIAIVASGTIWYRGQFYHDATIGEALPRVVAIMAAVALLAAAVAPVIGGIARAVPKGVGISRPPEN
jgi:hypothetical protein